MFTIIIIICLLEYECAEQQCIRRLLKLTKLLMQTIYSHGGLMCVCAAVRSISGHKAAITCLDFHRYGDILGSGSMDTNVKVQGLIVHQSF